MSTISVHAPPFLHHHPRSLSPSSSPHTHPHNYVFLLFFMFALQYIYLHVVCPNWPFMPCCRGRRSMLLASFLCASFSFVRCRWLINKGIGLLVITPMQIGRRFDFHSGSFSLSPFQTNTLRGLDQTRNHKNLLKKEDCKKRKNKRAEDTRGGKMCPFYGFPQTLIISWRTQPGTVLSGFFLAALFCCVVPMLLSHMP